MHCMVLVLGAPRQFLTAAGCILSYIQSYGAVAAAVNAED